MLTAQCLWLNTYRPMPATQCLLPADCLLLPTACLLLPTALLPLPTACPSPTNININTTSTTVAETATAAQLHGRVATTTAHQPLSLLALPVAHSASSR